MKAPPFFWNELFRLPAPLPKLCVSPRLLRLLLRLDCWDLSLKKPRGITPEVRQLTVACLPVVVATAPTRGVVTSGTLDMSRSRPRGTSKYLRLALRLAVDGVELFLEVNLFVWKKCNQIYNPSHNITFGCKGETRTIARMVFLENAMQKWVLLLTSQ